MRCRRRRERSLRDVAGDIRGRFATSHVMLEVASRRRIGHERSHRDIEMRYRFATLTLQNKFSAQATKNKFGAVKHKLIFFNFSRRLQLREATSHVEFDISHASRYTNSTTVRLQMQLWLQNGEVFG